MSRYYERVDEHGELLAYELIGDSEYVRGYRAFMLAPTPEIYRALLRGETVPIEKLDPRAAARYGLKTDAA